MKTILNFFKEWFLDMLFPKHCILCNRLIGAGKLYCVCDKCTHKLNDLRRVIIDEKSGMDEVICPFEYKDNVRNAMLDFKFRGIKYLGYTFAKEMSNMLKDRKFFEGEVIITAVPIHVTRDRVYNQSEVLAQNICKLTNKEYSGNLLYKIKPIDRISGMKVVDKKFFTKGAFHIDSRVNLTGKTVLVVDDIYTSGTTFKEISDMLRLRGASYVYGVTACYREKEED